MLVKLLLLLPLLLFFVIGQLELEKFCLASIALELIQTFKKMHKELQQLSLTFNSLCMPEAQNCKILFLHVNPGKQNHKEKLQGDDDDAQTNAASFMHVCVGTVLAHNLQPGLPEYLVAGLLDGG